jgi:hypothetical protein
MNLNPLEAIVVDYVKLYDKLHEKMNSSSREGGAQIYWEAEKLAKEVEGMLAALRSHVRAVYDTELKD